MSYVLDMLKTGKVSMAEFRPVTVYGFRDYNPVSLDEYKQTATEVNEYLKLLLEAQRSEILKMCGVVCRRRLL